METKDNHRLFNYRPIVIAAISLIFGVLTGTYVFTQKFYVSVSIFLFIIVCLVILNCFKTYKRLISFHKICVFACLILFIFSFGAVYLKVNSGLKNNYTNGQFIATATVCDVGDNMLMVNNVEAEYFENYSQLDGKNIKINGYVGIYILNEDVKVYKVGDTITLKCYITFNKSAEKQKNQTYELDLNYLVYNKVAQGKALASDIIITDTSTKVSTFDFIKNSCKSIFDKNLNKDIAGVAYAMVFGDKSGISNIYSTFQESGLAHLLAVSGLHVGFFTIILVGIANLLKLKNLPRFIFVTSVLFLYAWICNFSTSIVRAFIMSTVAMFATLRGKQYDGLNSLALSAIILLIINPFYFWNLGFELSFMAVLFIILLAPIIERKLCKICGNKLAVAISVSLAAQIGTLPVIIQIYPTQSAISVFTNLLAVPIASIGFMTLIVTTLITAVLPFMGFIMVIPEFALSLVVIIAEAVAGIKSLQVTFVPIKLFICLVVALGIIISDFIFLKKPIKQIGAGLLAISFVMVLGLY